MIHSLRHSFPVIIIQAILPTADHLVHKRALTHANDVRYIMREHIGICNMISSDHDIEYLENLSDPRIIRRMKVDIKSLRRNDRLFVINYLEVWAEILEEKIVIKSQKNALNDQLQSTDIYGKQEFETDKELNGLATKSNTSTT